MFEQIKILVLQCKIQHSQSEISKVYDMKVGKFDKTTERKLKNPKCLEIDGEILSFHPFVMHLNQLLYYINVKC
jgi:hypothetical protein